jgi:uncharacterized protein YqgC (DUF456 family)
MLSIFLAIVGWILFLLAAIVGVALNLVGLFGNWIILVAVALAGVATGFHYFSWGTLLVLLVLALLGELLEMIAAGVGAASVGGGKGAFIAALVGSLVGAVVGTPWLPVVGTVAGACLGAFIGATLYELLSDRGNVKDAARVGTGAAVGKLGGIAAKSAVGFAMLLVAAVSYWT